MVDVMETIDGVETGNTVASNRPIVARQQGSGLDAKALEAALNAMAIGDEETFKRSVIPAITAYLSALSPSPTGGEAGAVAWQQRERKHGEWSDWYPSNQDAYDEFLANVGVDSRYQVRALYTGPAPLMGEVEADVAENTTDNPKSWIAWKRRALAAEADLKNFGQMLTDETIIELAVAHSNYREGADFEVISHARLIEFARALLTKLQEGE